MNKAVHIALLTGGSDKPYAQGLATGLSESGVAIDFIGSDELDCRDIHEIVGLTFLNLRGDQRDNVSLARKLQRIAVYYLRLARYTLRRRPAIFHILWNNRFEFVDRTVLMLYFRALGKRVVLTAHNVNIARRDGRDGWLNHVSLRTQYNLCDHIFVHTEKMKSQLIAEFSVHGTRITVVPFGINETVPNSHLTPACARQRLGFNSSDKILLCFGQIAPYKGIDVLLRALSILVQCDNSIHLIIAGKVKRGSEDYWRHVTSLIDELGLQTNVHCQIGFIPDEMVEVYFKAADAAALAYRDIYQSGVPFLSFNFGVPVIATDVGSLKEDVIEGVTGFLATSPDATDIAAVVTRFFSSDLYRNAASHRTAIREFAGDRHSWAKTADLVSSVYQTLQ